MTWVTIVFVIFMSSNAFAEQPPSDLHRACHALSRNPSSPTPEILLSEVKTCEANFKNFLCEPVTKSWPELRKRLRKCDAISLCQGNGSPASALYGWGRGMVNNTIDGVTGLAELAWQKGYKDVRSSFEISAKCDALPACKRAVAEMVPWRKALTDEELKKYSSMRLMAESYVHQGLGKLSAFGSLAARCAENPSNAIPSREDLQKLQDGARAKLHAASDWLGQQTVLMALRYHCLDAQGQGELVGYTTAYVVDPAAAALAVSRSAFLLEAMKVSKAGLSEAAVSGLKPQSQGDSPHAPPVSAATAGTNVLDTERRQATSASARTSGDGPRAPPRDEFVAANVAREFTSVEQNERFIALAKSTPADRAVRFIDIENSVMKKLNDQTRDKNLVTSLTNSHKTIVFEKLKDLEARNPGLVLSSYSDFKSVRVAATGKIPADLERQLQGLFKEANSEFASDVLKRGLVRESDSPQNWFRAGIGETADQANLAARTAREQGTAANSLVNFSHESTVSQASARLQEVEMLRSQTVKVLAATPLLENASSSASSSVAAAASKPTLTREAFDLVRKYPEPAALQAAVQKRYGLTGFSAAQSESMINYAKAVDEFSPGIHVAKREMMSLDDAAHGGFSIDFLGLGASNQSATASGLARATDLKDALVQTRRGEEAVTTEFQARIQRFKEIAGPFAKCSGDDCIGLATAPLKQKDKFDLANKLAADERTRGIRVSFVGSGVTNKVDRTTLATHGESIEKFVRKSLEGKVPIEKSGSTIFAVDMRTPAANQGQVELIVAGKPGLSWTKSEWRAIQKAFAEAVEAHNKDLLKENIRSNYRPGRTLPSQQGSSRVPFSNRTEELTPRLSP